RMHPFGETERYFACIVSGLLHTLNYDQRADRTAPTRAPALLFSGSASGADAMSSRTRWEDAQRIEGWAGEIRVNLIRLAALLISHGHPLVNVFLIQDDPSVRGDYHAAVTALVLAWAVAILVVHLCLSRRWVPPALKYATTAWDLFLITTLLLLGGD